MATTIQWTNETWNPTTGCTKVSSGCANCYIERTPPFRMEGRKFVKGHIPLQLHENRLSKPLHWRKPRRVFVNSLSDLFHKDVPDEFIDRVFAVMALCPQHTFQVLTKRPERMAEYLAWHRGGRVYRTALDYGYSAALKPMVVNGEVEPWPLPNVWLGTSVENQATADERIPHLLRCPAAVRFLSLEPLLEGVVFIRHCIEAKLAACADVPLGRVLNRQLPSFPWIDWAIVGCESNGRRVGRLGEFASEAEWLDGARGVVRQCREGGVVAFVKQIPLNGRVSHDPEEWPEDIRVRQFPGGRE